MLGKCPIADAPTAGEMILVIDEVQKLKNWSEYVKKEWDADSLNHINLKVILLCSSRVLLEKGLAESLMGRYEEIRMSHWSYPEMREAFNMSLEQYIYYGGYAGAAQLIEDEERWANYVNGPSSMLPQQRHPDGFAYQQACPAAPNI